MDKSKTSKLKISYDADVDVLYVTLGTPKRVVCSIEKNGILIKYNPVTKKVIGFTIVDFLTRFSKKNVTTPIKGELQLIS